MGKRNLKERRKQNKINLTYMQGLTTDEGYYRQWKHEGTGIVKELFTERKNGFPVEGSEEVMFYHPKDKDTHNSFMKALESACELKLVSDVLVKDFRV